MGTAGSSSNNSNRNSIEKKKEKSRLKDVDIISIVSKVDGADDALDHGEEDVSAFALNGSASNLVRNESNGNMNGTNLKKTSSLSSTSNTKPISILKKYSSSSSTMTNEEKLQRAVASISFNENEKSSTSYKFRFGHRRQNSEVNDGIIRLVLFGGVNSGKTTIVKALKLLYFNNSSVLSSKEKERRINEIRTTVLKSAVTVIKRRGTQGWSQDAVNAANALLRSSSFVFIGDRVDENEDVSFAPTASALSPSEYSRHRQSSVNGDSDEDEDENENDDAIAQVIATEDEVHAQISADAAVAAVLSETELENQAKARAAALIPMPSQRSLQVTKAASIRSIETTSQPPQPANIAHTNSISNSFNSTHTSDVGRVVYDPKKHNTPVLTANANDLLKGSKGPVISPIEKKKSSSSSPFNIFSRKKESLSRPSSNESIKEKKVSTSSNGSNNNNATSSISVTQPVRHIATARESFDGDEEGLPVAEHVMFDAQIVDSLRTLYSSEDFQRARLASPSIDSYAGAGGLASHLDNIAASDYQGNDIDYLCAKTHSPENTVCVTELKIQGTSFKIYDVTIEIDLVSEWKSDFDIASTIVYVVALDTYDYPEKENKAKKGFKKVCKKFKGKPFVLLLNKVDLFREKLRYVPFYMKGVRNEKYKGPRPDNAVSQQEFDSSVIAVQNFIVTKYQRIWRKKTGGSGNLVIHFTQSTSPEQIDCIFRATKDSIINSPGYPKS